MTMLYDIITLVGLAASLAIFLYSTIRIAIKTGKIPTRNLQFQLAIATLVWLVGESLDVSGRIFMTPETPNIIHTGSMALYAAFVVLRLPRVLKQSQ